MSRELPAFPQTHPKNPSPETGMTLRDYFAGQAVIGLAGSEEVWRWVGKHDAGGDKMASLAYELADEMLKAREET